MAVYLLKLKRNSHTLPPPAPPLFRIAKNPAPPLFGIAKKRETKKSKKNFRSSNHSKSVTKVKFLSLRSNLYCLTHSRASRIQKFFLRAKHGG